MADSEVDAHAQPRDDLDDWLAEVSEDTGLDLAYAAEIIRAQSE